jgi:hypothetical protein
VEPGLPTTARRLVADSSVLRDPALAHFLASHPENRAVVPEVSAFEPYKNGSVDSIARTFETLCRQSRQVLILHGTDDIISAEEHGALPASKYIDVDQTAGISEFCQHLRVAVAGASLQRAHIEAHREAAAANVARTKRGYESTLVGLKGFEEHIGAEHVRHLRRGTAGYPRDLMLKALHFAVALSRDFCSLRYGPPATWTTDFRNTGRFLFRFSLATTALALWWTRNGGLDTVAVGKLTNDMLDMQQVAYATRFDGILTRDAKMKEIHDETRSMLDSLAPNKPGEKNRPDAS